MSDSDEMKDVQLLFFNDLSNDFSFFSISYQVDVIVSFFSDKNHSDYCILLMIRKRIEIAHNANCTIKMKVSFRSLLFRLLVERN